MQQTLEGMPRQREQRQCTAAMVVVLQQVSGGMGLTGCEQSTQRVSGFAWHICSAWTFGLSCSFQPLHGQRGWVKHGMYLLGTGGHAPTRPGRCMKGSDMGDVGQAQSEEWNSGVNALQFTLTAPSIPTHPPTTTTTTTTTHTHTAATPARVV